MDRGGGHGLRGSSNNSALLSALPRRARQFGDRLATIAESVSSGVRRVADTGIR